MGELMSRSRAVLLSVVAAVLLVGGVAYAASGPATSPGGMPGPVTAGHLGGSSVDDSVFESALGLVADGSAGSADVRPQTPRRPCDMRPVAGRHCPMIRVGQWVLHGEAVVKDRDGNFVTVATQAGEVTAVDKSSLTVKSEDGYTRTWTRTEATRYWGFWKGTDQQALKVGADVRVAGSVMDGVATARLIWFPPKAWSHPPMPQKPPQSPQTPQSPSAPPGTPSPSSTA